MRPYLFVLMAWALAACTDKTPASVEFTAPQLVLSSNTEAALAPLVRNQAGEALDNYRSLNAAPPVSHRLVAAFKISRPGSCMSGGSAAAMSSQNRLNEVGP